MVIFLFTFLLPARGGIKKELVLNYDAQVAQLTVTKTATMINSTVPDPFAFTDVGDEITYEITIENSGTDDIYTLSVADAGATNGPTYQSGDANANDTLEVGEAWIYSSSYEVIQADVDAGFYTNTANVTGNYTDGNGDLQSMSDSDSETVTGSQQPALSITKTASPATFNSAGEEIIYTIEVENTGNVELTSVSVTDPLTGLNENISNMLPGATENYTSTYFITQA
ncbi:DUF7507 domain-containing protein, partial [Tangfeifania diversioriginum]